jgi:hypothetical protein
LQDAGGTLTIVTQNGMQVTSHSSYDVDISFAGSTNFASLKLNYAIAESETQILGSVEKADMSRRFLGWKDAYE